MVVGNCVVLGNPVLWHGVPVKQRACSRQEIALGSQGPSGEGVVGGLFRGVTVQEVLPGVCAAVPDPAEPGAPQFRRQACRIGYCVILVEGRGAMSFRDAGPRPLARMTSGGGLRIRLKELISGIESWFVRLNWVGDTFWGGGVKRRGAGKSCSLTWASGYAECVFASRNCVGEPRTIR